MKSALAYVRISNKDQSNFSIDAQVLSITEYCERQGIRIHHVFTDDGFSAKNFDRPDWGKLKELLNRERGRHSYLIVYKYDRLIRNTMEGLAQLDELEKKHRLTVVSVCENLNLDPDSPYFRFIRTGMLSHGELERDIISSRVLMGRNQAQKSGRYLGIAPYGYTNEKDDINKPILAIQPGESLVVQQIFSDYASGKTQHEILLRVRAKGFFHKGHCPIKKILSNITYCGFIRVKAHMGNPETIVKGLHQPIISEEMFWAIQSRLQNTRQPLHHKVLDERLPLRGAITCQCGNTFTGAMSRGRHGKKWGYYICNGCRLSLSALKAHADAEKVFTAFSLTSDATQRLMEKIKSRTAAKLKERAALRHKSEKAVADLIALIESTEEKFIRNSITLETFERQMQKFTNALQSEKAVLATLAKDDSEIIELLDASLPRLCQLGQIWNQAAIQDKHQLIRMVFPQGLIRLKDTYQTPQVLPLFTMQGTVDAPLQITGNAVKGNVPVGTPTGIEIKPFLIFLNSIKAA
ncbi:MAG: recombinase family protein [Alphaproteobacteria bacterium]